MRPAPGMRSGSTYRLAELTSVGVTLLVTRVRHAFDALRATAENGDVRRADARLYALEREDFFLSVVTGGGITLAMLLAHDVRNPV